MSKTSVQSASRRVRFSLPAAGLLAALVLVGCGKDSTVDYELTATLIQPVARLELQRVTVVPGNRSGEELYKALCTSCHAGGLLGAPKTGNAEEWAPRMEKGLEANVASLINGLGAMPPRAGSPDLTDAEAERAVAYLMNQAGGSFTEPPVE